MYDFTKTSINDAQIIKQIEEKKENLSFHIGYHCKLTGEVYNKSKLGFTNSWQGRKFDESLMELTGSIHRYSNFHKKLDKRGSEYGNSNDLRYFDACLMYMQLSKELGISSKRLPAHSLEYGLNFRVRDVGVSDYMNLILCLKNQLPNSRVKIKEKKAHFIQFKFDNYYLNIYNKALQYKGYGEDIGDLIRIEIRARKNRHFKHIRTLSDIFNPANHQQLRDEFLKVIGEIVFIDPTIDVSEMTKADKTVYDLLSNPLNWKLKDDEKKTSTRLAKEQRFIEIVERYGRIKPRKMLLEMVAEKWDELSVITEEERLFLKQYNYDDPEKFCGFSPLIRGGISTKKDIEGNRIGISYEQVENPYETVRTCCTCSKDISKQRKQSKFCSEKYVGKEEAQKCRNGRRKIMKKQQEYQSKFQGHHALVQME